MMNTFSFLISIQVLLIPVSLHPCAPSCKPPKNVCRIQEQSKRCTLDVSALSETSAHCGCLWQCYLRSVDSSISDTDKCITWAVITCSSLDEAERSRLCNDQSSDVSPLNEGTFIEEKVSLSSVPAPLIEIVRNILTMARSPKYKKSHEIAKSRKRNGVSFGIPNRSQKGKHRDRFTMVEGRNVPVLDIRRLTKPPAINLIMPKPPAGNFKVQGQAEGNSKASKSLDGQVIIGKLEKYEDSQLNLTPEIPSVQKSVASSKIRVQQPTVQLKDSKNVTAFAQPFRTWMDFKIPPDQFKLIVFAIILLLNILVVLVLIFCRNNESNETEKKDSKPMGDLNLSVYKGPPPEEPSLRNRPKDGGWNLLVKKCKQTIQERRDRKRREEHPFLYMEEHNAEDFSEGQTQHSDVLTSSPYVNTGFHRKSQRSSQRASRGLYESIDEDPSYLDSTYEEPLLPTLRGKRQPYSLKSDQGSEDSSPTKYYPRDQDEKNKSISFALPAGTFITLQDRMVASPVKRKRKRAGGLLIPAKMALSRK